MADEQSQSNIKINLSTASVGMNMDNSINYNDSGVYCIFNTISKKYYIGSSLNIRKRLLNHKRLLTKNKHHSYKLQLSFNKYGKDVFEFKILDLFIFPESYSKKIKIEYLECLEEFYIKKYNSYKEGYNVSEIPRIVGNTNTPESIQKGINTRKLKGSYFCSVETKLKRSISLKNSAFFKQQQKIAARKKCKKIYEYDLEGNFIKEWENAEDISKKLNIYKGSIFKNIYGIINKCKRSIFRYEKFEKIPAYKYPEPKRKCKKVVIENIKTKEIVIFDDYKKCALNCSLKPSTVLSYINKEKLFKSIFKFYYGQ